MENEFQAHYIALKTLRQRCEYLQQRLDAVEEENCQLKLQKVQEPISRTSRPSFDNSSLQEQLILLNKQKSQMSSKIQMMTIENHSLWSQLSKLMSGSDDLGEKFSVPGVSISSQDMKFSQPTKNTHENCSNSLYCDCTKESLEEISLKLMNGILMSKAELENQCSQMTELQKENESISLKNFSFSSTQLDNRATMNSMKSYIQNLKDFKQALYQQKNELSSAITNMKNFQKNTVSNNSNSDTLQCDNSNVDNNDRANINSSCDLATLQQSTKTSDEGNSNIQICPMCGKHFTEKFLEFYEHVTNHFEDNDEYVDASSTYEIIP